MHLHNYRVAAILSHKTSRLTGGGDSLQTRGQMTSPPEATKRPDTQQKFVNVKINSVPRPHPSEVHLTFSDSFADLHHLTHIRATCKQTTPQSALVICRQRLWKNLKLLTVDKFALNVFPHHCAGLRDDPTRFKEGWQTQIK